MAKTGHLVRHGLKVVLFHKPANRKLYWSYNQLGKALAQRRGFLLGKINDWVVNAKLQADRTWSVGVKAVEHIRGSIATNCQLSERPK